MSVHLLSATAVWDGKDRASTRHLAFCGEHIRYPVTPEEYASVVVANYCHAPDGYLPETATCTACRRAYYTANPPRRVTVAPEPPAWRITITRGRAMRMLPGSFPAPADAIARVLTHARKVYADVECYCGQGEFCACGGWVSGPLSLIRGIESDLAYVRSNGADEGETLRFAFPNGSTFEVWYL